MSSEFKIKGSLHTQDKLREDTNPIYGSLSNSSYDAKELSDHIKKMNQICGCNVSDLQIEMMIANIIPLGRTLSIVNEIPEEKPLTKKKIKQMIKSAERVGNYMEVKRLREMYSKCKL